MHHRGRPIRMTFLIDYLNVVNRKPPNEVMPRTRWLYRQSLPAKEELISVLLKLSQRGEDTCKLILQGQHSPYTNARSTDTPRKESYRPAFLVNIDAKLLKRMPANQTPQHVKRVFPDDQWIDPWGTGSGTWHQVNRLKDKNDVVG